MEHSTRRSQDSNDWRDPDRMPYQSSGLQSKNPRSTGRGRARRHTEQSPREDADGVGVGRRKVADGEKSADAQQRYISCKFLSNQK